MNRDKAIRRLKNAAEILQMYVFDDEECIAQDMKDYNEALKMAIEALQDRPKGEWKCMADCGVTECDQCGWNVEEYVGDYNYCPNCGARMTPYKGGDDE